MRTFFLPAAAWLLLAGAASGQTAETTMPVERGDFHAVIGWQNLRQERDDEALESYNNWANGILYGGAGAGWYWNAHLKTQVDVGAGSRGQHYAYRLVNVNGQSTSESA